MHIMKYYSAFEKEILAYTKTRNEPWKYAKWNMLVT